jgi:hypothetical protein
MDTVPPVAMGKSNRYTCLAMPVGNISHSVYIVGSKQERL